METRESVRRGSHLFRSTHKRNETRERERESKSFFGLGREGRLILFVICVWHWRQFWSVSSPARRHFRRKRQCNVRYATRQPR